VVVANAVYPQTFAIRIFWLFCGVAMAGRELAAVHRPALTPGPLPSRRMRTAPE
jgi:hypothetical protein